MKDRVIKQRGIDNGRSESFSIAGYIGENNCYNNDESAAVQINPNETKTFKYIMPSEASVWVMYTSGEIYLETTPEGIEADIGEVYIFATAQDGLTITVIDNGGGGDGPTS